MYTTLALTMFAVPLVMITTYGVYAPVIIFSQSWMLICAGAMIFALSKGKPDIMKASVVMIVSCVFLLARQLPYMFNSPVVDDGFGSVLNFMLCAVLVFSLVGVIRHSSQNFRTEGVSPSTADNKIYLVLKRPKSFIDYLSCILGSQASSVSFCINGQWIRFKQKDGCATFGDLRDCQGYEFVDTGVIASESQRLAFGEVHGKPWSWGKNCVTAWYNLTYGTFLQPHPWEWLPSLYVSRVLKEIKR